MLHYKNQKTDNGKPNYKNLIEFPHPITAFITVLDPQGECCSNQALSMPWQSTRLRLFLTRATSGLSRWMCCGSLSSRRRKRWPPRHVSEAACLKPPLWMGSQCPGEQGIQYCEGLQWGSACMLQLQFPGRWCGELRNILIWRRQGIDHSSRLASERSQCLSSSKMSEQRSRQVFPRCSRCTIAWPAAGESLTPTNC